MVEEMVNQYEGIGDKPQGENPFGGKKAVGKCPNCGCDVLNGKFGIYCSGKCGMSLTRAMGAQLSEADAVALLEKKKIFLKGLKGRSGKVYDAYLQPVGVEEYSYTDREGNNRNGFQYKFEMSFPDKKKN